MGVEHELKCHPNYLRRVISGQKTFEIRKNDRDYQLGDVLVLKEFDPAIGWQKYQPVTYQRVEVVYMTTFEQKDGYVVMGIKLLENAA